MTGGEDADESKLSRPTGEASSASVAVDAEVGSS